MTTMHVCGAICGPETEEVSRRPHGKERWCFRCRTVRAFEYVVIMPVVDRDNPSYYGPTPSVECATCGLVDGDMFPGTWREWDDI